jgi:alkyldihydroxyacetonephosphate synthase
VSTAHDPSGESQRIEPDPPAANAADVESLDVWGFRDTRFHARADGVVELTGKRYELSGQDLPDLLDWVKRTIHPDVSPDDLFASSYPPAIPAQLRNEHLEAALAKALRADQISGDAELRLRHGHGHTLEEMWAIKHGRLARVPDWIVWPENEAEVEAIVAAALAHDAVLVPYGGGTNVTDALRCPTGEQRTIVSVDMARMNRVLWIDPVNRMACIQAGAVGRQIAEALAKHGFTMGHEPDSVEFSTLGGWIATHCSGMKKNRYGNIEDIVLDVTVATARGRLERTAVNPRESVGSADPRRWLFGSEGCLGIVTSAVVKLAPLPEAEVYGSVVFPDFETGFRFLYDLQAAGALPASVRLVDNLQFQLSQMLKPRATGWKSIESRIQRLVVTKVKGFAVDRMSACTIVFEGSKDEVAAQQKRTYALAKRYGGLAGGASNGRRGYQLTFGIAYIRDWIMNHWLLGESFETSVPWSRALALCDNVKRRIREECAKRGVPGTPFVTSRITQLYPSGVCVYFYFAFYFKGLADPAQIYAEVEHAARDEILRSGGSLSHHHGVGKIRKGFLPRIASPGVAAFARDIKAAVDPTNVFGAGNQLLAPRDGA